MVLFFDLEKLEDQSHNNPTKFLAMLENHFMKRLPNKYSKHLYSKVRLYGKSFLLNPADFFNDTTTDILYKVQYVKLAAIRDWSLYKLYKYTGLQTSYYPDLLYDQIRSNPLLEITKTELKFKYEI